MLIKQPSFSIRRLALLALLSALACVGRLVFVIIPNVQPVTVILLIITLELTWLDGLIVASLSIFLSNLFLGMGPWTLYQIITFMIIISITALFKPLWKNFSHSTWLMLFFSLLAGLLGYLYGFIISIFSVYLYRIPNFWIYYLQGLAFDSLHAIGNVIFWWLLSPILPPLFQLISKKTR